MCSGCVEGLMRLGIEMVMVGSLVFWLMID